jgi:transcription elongation factor GreA-like protein
MNHPTKYLIQHICREIRTLTGVEFDIRDEVDCLGGSQKSILYACIQPMVEFDIRDHQPITSLKTTPEDIAQVYYDTYKTIF